MTLLMLRITMMGQGSSGGVCYDLRVIMSVCHKCTGQGHPPFHGLYGVAFNGVAVVVIVVNNVTQGGWDINLCTYFRSHQRFMD